MKRDDPEAMRAYRRKYNASPKGRAARERYAATEKGRTAQLKSKRQYNHAHTTELKAYNVQRRREFGERINAIKIEKGCSRCGYRGHPAALDFDHVDPMSKRANVSNLARFGSWATIEAEIAKCDVLCANCHRIRTVERLAAGTPIGLCHPSLFDEETA